MFANAFSLVKKRYVVTFWQKFILKNSKTSLCFFQSIEFNKALKPRSQHDGYFYVTDPVASRTISQHLSENCTDKYVFEANPGPGILTQAFLQSGITKLRVFEKNTEFLPHLEALSTKYIGLEIIEKDLLLLPGIEARSWKENADYIEKFYSSISQKSWESDPILRIFSIIINKRSIRFLRYLLIALPKKSAFFVYGRCELFLLVSEREFSYMSAEPKENLAAYRWSTVLYKLFFDIICLEKFSSDILYPSPTIRTKNKIGGNMFFLVKLIPKADLFSSLVRDNKLSDFYFFIRQHLVKRTGLVIPAMEGWIPCCGPRLIKDGMNVFTKFGDLSPKQLLLLFNQFSSWPEYEHSTFCAALERYNKKKTKILEEEEEDN